MHAHVALPSSVSQRIEWKTCGTQLLVCTNSEERAVALERVSRESVTYSIRLPFEIKARQYVFSYYEKNRTKHQHDITEHLSRHEYSALKGFAMALMRAYRKELPEPRIRFYGQMLYVLHLNAEMVEFDSDHRKMRLRYDRADVSSCFESTVVTALDPRFALLCECLWSALEKVPASFHQYELPLEGGRNGPGTSS
jgi:hypothetical protein